MAKRNKLLIYGIIVIVVLGFYLYSQRGTQNTFSVSSCGNFDCESGENYSNCPIDCPTTCIEKSISYYDCEIGWDFKFAKMQCINGSWEDVVGINPCYCSGDEYCSDGYHCLHNICTTENPKFCSSTADCKIAGFYCNDNHTCSVCPYSYSFLNSISGGLFSIQDCQFSNFKCMGGANDCYFLTTDYCKTWNCIDNTCVQGKELRYSECCESNLDCLSTQQCTDHSCSSLPPKPKTSPIVAVLSIVIVLGIIIGAFFIYNKYFKKGE